MTKIYPLFLLLLLLFSCKSDYYLDSENPVNPESNFNFGNTTQKNFQGLILSTDGNPVSGATVTIGSSTVQTNTKGFFIFKNAQVQENFAHVKVTKAGFVNASRVMVPTAGDNRVNIMMIPATTTSTITAGSTATVSLSDGTKVKFDGSFKDAGGNPYSGNVSVAVFHLSPSNQYLNELLPGSFLATNSGGNARVMETYGMLHVQLTGASGQNLQIANGHTAEITVPLDAAQLSSSPNTIPLWSYNEETGLWQEDGSATKVGNTYVGNVSHFSWWNCDAQFEQATLKVVVKNQAGQPMANVRVGLTRNNQSYETTAFTDSNGSASGIVPANETLTMKIYDACNAVVYSTTISALPAGVTTTLPDILVQPTVSQFTIQGVLKNCSNANVTDGFVAVKFAGTSYFQSMIANVTNGNFAISTYGCVANPQFVLEGYDMTTLQTSGEISFTGVSPATNLGNITVCTSISEFINYQIDNQAIKYVFSPINAIFNNVQNPPVPFPTLTISGQSPTGSFYLNAMNVAGVGTYNTNFTLEFSGGYFNATGNNVILQVSNFGAVGQYIDFTVNGTYTDSTGTHTINGTGHVKRD